MKKLSQKGMTFIEVILGIAIIGAGLIGVMYAFTSGTKSSIAAEQTIVGGNLAREKMEQIIADKSNQGYALTITTNYSDGQLTGDYDNYTRTVTITEVNPDADGGDDDFLDAQAGSGYARVTVTVSWNGGSTKVETLIADYTMP